MNAHAIEWNHFKVFVALVAKGLPIKSFHLQSPYYVKLYPQQTNTALLYDLDRPNAPVHIHEAHVDPDVWTRIKPHLRKISDHPDAKGFDYYSVEDWNAFASSLGLDD